MIAIIRNVLPREKNCILIPTGTGGGEGGGGSGGKIVHR